MRPGIGDHVGYLGNVSSVACLWRVFCRAYSCASMMIFVHFISLKRLSADPRRRRSCVKSAMQANRLFPRWMPAFIIGGIQLGIFSATEAGSVAIVYAIVVGFLFIRV
ncbi:MAG: TRAP transporter large permease subunit [Christensenellales bacterium]